MSKVDETVVDASPHVLYSLWQNAFVTGATMVRVIDTHVDGVKHRLWIKWQMVDGRHFGMKYLTMTFEVQKKFCFAVRFGGEIEIDKTQLYRPSYAESDLDTFVPNFEDFWLHDVKLENDFPAEDIEHFLMMAAMNLPKKKDAE